MPQDLSTAFTFVLEIDSVEMASFRKCSGIQSELETIEYKEATKEGRMIIRKVPGAAKWADITLERRSDGSTALWEWHKQALDGDLEAARRNGSIVIKDPKLEEVARWNFVAGWPSKWSGSDFDANSNDVATETVTISHEGLTRA